MNYDNLIISRGNLKKGQLNGKIALVTGGGSGIGYEGARSLLWLGAKVIIAEIDKEKGRRSEKKLGEEFGRDNVLFIKTDIGDERSIKKLVKKINNSFGSVDIIINNATTTPIGSVHEVGVDKWDLSYKINLRGPVLLISHFLPQMIKRNSGVIVLVPSSGAAPYMGAYEVFKTSQVELSNTLAAELEGTGVITYSIGPGIVKTEGANRAINKVAPLYGKTVEEFYKMSENALITVEEAGAGFAASVVLADKYRGLEIGSIQALMDIGISIGQKNNDEYIKLSQEERDKVLGKFEGIRKIFIEQIDGWEDRPLFERQWVKRDFKKHMGATAEVFLDKLGEFENAVLTNKLSVYDFDKIPIDKIYSYYQHQIELLKGYEKNKDKVREYSEIMNGWLNSIDDFKNHTKEIITSKVSN